MKVFISFASEDKIIAEELAASINNTFSGDIKIFYSPISISAGEDWRKSIKENLNECDAIISLITKTSILKPWIYIEWSAFWINNKKHYLILTPDVNISQLIHPMQDRNVTYIDNLDSVKGLIKNLSKDSDVKLVPYDKAEDIIINIKSSIALQTREQEKLTYSKYKGHPELLPSSDDEKEKIALYFYNIDNKKEAINIIKRIRNENTKYNLSLFFLDSSDIESAYEITELMRSASNQAEIVIQMINYEYEDSKYVKLLIENISNKSQDQLRVICAHLKEINRIDSQLFDFVLESFTSMAELRKIAALFIEDKIFNLSTFDDIVTKLLENNRAELRKVGISFIENDVYENDVFKNLIIKMAQKNQKETGKLLFKLKEKDLDYYNDIINLNIIVDEAVIV